MLFFDLTDFLLHSKYAAAGEFGLRSPGWRILFFTAYGAIIRCFEL
jgi:hypothetical protein